MNNSITYTKVLYPVQYKSKFDIDMVAKMYSYYYKF